MSEEISAHSSDSKPMLESSEAEVSPVVTSAGRSPPSSNDRSRSASHGLTKIVRLVAFNVAGFVVIGAGLIYGWAVISAKLASAMEAAGGPQQAAMYMPLLNPHVGAQSIKLLNSTHIYLMSVIVAALALLTAVDAVLEMCVEYVADRALISTRLVSEMETGDYDLAITNAGYSTRVKSTAPPPKAAPPAKKAKK